MAQVTIYLPEALEKQLRREARKAKKSLSAYIADLARVKTTGGWPKGYASLFGSWEGELQVPDDTQPEDVDTL